MLPVQITVKDMPISPALEKLLRKKAQKLKQYYDRIMSCRIVIEVPQKHKHQGKLFNVRIDVTMPGKELAVTRKSDQDIYVAIRDSFDAIERQLEEHARKRHGRVKKHNSVMRGYIKRIIANEGYGFIEGIDGNEYYFSVTNVNYPTFDRLRIGDAVDYLVEQESDGLQAHRVVKERDHEER